MAIVIQKADLASTGFTNTNTNGAGGINVNVGAGSTVKTAIDAAVAAAVGSLPTDKFVTAGSYNAATDTLTLTFTDSTTVNIAVGPILADALASINVPLYGNDGTTVLGYIKA